jgi:glycosyltransferase involved in cell wall biosynthesis
VAESNSTDCCVLLPFYNAARTIENTLDSLVASFVQAGTQPKILALDDGSSDISAALVESYASTCSGIDLIRSHHVGLPAILNLGLAKCPSSRFLRVDADDKVRPAFVSALTSAGADSRTVVACDRVEILPGCREKRMNVDPSNLFSLAGSGLSLDVDTVLSAGSYRDMFWEEYDLYLRLHRLGALSIERIAEPLYEYNRQSGGMTSDEGARTLGWEMLGRVWGDHAIAGADLNIEARDRPAQRP